MHIGTLRALVLCLAASSALAAQTPPPHTEVSGQVTVTNNGMSTIPAFTLGDPAALLYLFVRRGAFSLEPEFRTGLDGMPWAFIVWGRYRLQREHFSLGISAHPAFNFKQSTVANNGTTRELIVARRYLVGELTPTWIVSPHAAVGATYLYLHGVESDVPKHTNFIAVRSSLFLPLPSSFGLRIAPQAYYLHMGQEGGTYVFGQITLSRRKWPVSISTAANEPLHTTIVAGHEFSWNLSAHYVVQ